MSLNRAQKVNGVQVGQINEMTFAGIEPRSLANRAIILPAELNQLAQLVIDNGHPEFPPRNLHWESNTEPTLPVWLPCHSTRGVYSTGSGLCQLISLLLVSLVSRWLVMVGQLC